MGIPRVPIFNSMLVLVWLSAFSGAALASFKEFNKCMQAGVAASQGYDGYTITQIDCVGDGSITCDLFSYYLNGDPKKWFGGQYCTRIPFPDGPDDKDGFTESAPPPPEGGPRSCGSQIDVLSQSVGERIAIAGTPYSLVYNSSQGRRSFEYGVSMGACSEAVAGGGNPDCNLTISTPLGGTVLMSRDFVGGPGQELGIVWDSLDQNGERINFPKYLTIAYKFLSGVAAGIEYRTTALVGTFDSRFYGLGGWSIDVLHAYDGSGDVLSNNGTIYYGDGRAEFNAGTIISSGIAVKPSAGGEWYIFDRNGHHKKTVTNLLGAPIHSFSYDAAGRVLSITDAGGLVTQVQRDTNGNPVAIVAPFGQVTQLSLTNAGFLASVTDPGGNVTKMTYKDARGLLATFQPPGVAATKFTYDNKGLLTRDLNPTGRMLNFTRQGDSGGQTTVTQTSGLGVQMSVAAQSGVGQQSSQVVTPAGETIARQSSYGGNQISVQDSQGSHETAFVHDDRLQWFVSDARKILSHRFTSPFAAVDRILEYAESYTLSTSANIFSVKTADFSVKLNGLLTSIIFDRASNTYTTTTPAGRKSTVKIDNLERPVRSQLGTLAAMTFTYDASGRPSKITQGTRASQFVYDGQGNLGQIIDPLGRTTSYAHDAVGRVTAITLPDSRVIGLGYNARGLLTRVTPTGRSKTVQDYNAFDNLTQFTPPALGTVPEPQTIYNYDLDQRLSQVVRPSGATIDLGYDAARGTLASIITADGANVFTTDALGQITGSQFGDVTLAFVYDGAFEAASSINWNGVSAQMLKTYGALGLLAGQAVTAGANTSSVTFSYDKDQLLTRVGKLSLTRDAATGLIATDLLNAVSTDYAYNNFGEMVGQTARFNGAMLFSQDLTRDATGRITKVIEKAGNTSVARAYGYDAAGRLSQVTENGQAISSYTYDANSNRIGGFTRSGPTSASYDGQDRIKTYGNLTFAYNADGERTAMTDTATGAMTTYQYDAYGNLAHSNTPGPDIIYTIDGLGRRVTRSVNSIVKSHYVYDDQFRIAAELTASGAMVRRFVYGPNDSVPQYLIKSGRLYRYLIDANGSIRMVVDALSGAIAQQITYDEFGRVNADTNPGFQQLGFAGGLTDPATGLVHFGARDYDPATGRWLSQDPIHFDGGDTNLYGYVLQDPVNFADQSGLSPTDVTTITQVANDTINDMTKRGQRTSPGWWNNNNKSFHDFTGGRLGHPYQGCYEQADTLEKSLANRKYDDKWSFTQSGSNAPHWEPQHPLGFNLLPHWWLEAHSNNPNDPVLIIDPYNGIVRPK